MVGIVVMALLISLGMPSMIEWMQNVRVRSAAEGLSGALQLARSEAVRSNGTIIFQLMSSLDNGCVADTSGKNWVVSMCPAQGACGNTPNRNQERPTAGCTGEPLVLAKGALEGSDGAEISIPNGVICYSGLGRINPTASDCPAGTLDPATSGGSVAVDITSTQGACTSSGGDVRCLRITIAPGGETRMCDPAVTSGDDPRKC